MAAPEHKAADQLLQSAIFSALDGTVSATVTDWLDEAPSFPVVIIGDMFDEDLSSTTSRGQQLRARLTVISEAHGWKEAQQIKSEIMAELDSTTFNLGTDFDHVYQRYLRSNPRRRTAGTDEHRMLRYLDLDFTNIVVRT